jgi:hypothetical protein
MIITLTEKEFKEVRETVAGLGIPEATTSFNNIFTNKKKDSVRGFANPLERTVIINIPEEIVVPIGKVLASYSDQIGILSTSGSSMPIALKWANMIKEIINSFKRVLK